MYRQYSLSLVKSMRISLRRPLRGLLPYNVRIREGKTTRFPAQGFRNVLIYLFGTGWGAVFHCRKSVLETEGGSRGTINPSCLRFRKAGRTLLNLMQDVSTVHRSLTNMPLTPQTEPLRHVGETSARNSYVLCSPECFGRNCYFFSSLPHIVLYCSSAQLRKR